MKTITMKNGKRKLIKHWIAIAVFLFSFLFSHAVYAQKIKWPQSFTPQAQKSLKDTIRAIAGDSTRTILKESAWYIKTNQTDAQIQVIFDSLSANSSGRILAESGDYTTSTDYIIYNNVLYYLKSFVFFRRRHAEGRSAYG